MKERLVLDGSHGEGGGQIVRTAVTLSAVSGRAVRIERVRAGRAKPGLGAQHVAAVRGVAAVCGAEVSGDWIGSATLEFRPRSGPRAGHYDIDVGAMRGRGSAGAVTLVLQAMAVPLALGPGRSTVTLRGGTHTFWSPPYDYLPGVWAPALEPLGIELDLELRRVGWYPGGGGEIRAAVAGGERSCLRPFVCNEPGALVRIGGRVVASGPFAAAAGRMAERAREVLRAEGLSAEIALEFPEAASPGAAIFLAAEYAGARAGFGGLGEQGKPVELVAEEAARALVAHHRSGAAFDVHLGDQILLPAALAAGPSRFTVSSASRHLLTNAWVIERFGLGRVEVLGGAGRPVQVRVLAG